MGASSDYMEEVGPSSKGEVDDMDMDEDLMDTTNLNELGKETLQSFLDSRGSLIHLVRLLLSLDTIHPSRRMVNGDVHQLGLERSTLIDQAFGVILQIYTQTVGRRDKFKTGIDKVVQKNVVHTENREIIMGRMPVM
ncbi:hypothetical protein OIU85_022588, partial [Salix viminalis]